MVFVTIKDTNRAKSSARKALEQFSNLIDSQHRLSFTKGEGFLAVGLSIAS